MTQPATSQFSADVLRLDAAATVETIERAIRQQVLSLHRRGVVLGLSGGIDSSVVAYLCVRALGLERVLALLISRQVRRSTPVKMWFNGASNAAGTAFACLIVFALGPLHVEGVPKDAGPYEWAVLAVAVAGMATFTLAATTPS